MDPLSTVLFSGILKLMTTHFRRTEEFLNRGVYLPPSKQLNETSELGLGRAKVCRDFMEEEASLNINQLIINARIEQTAGNDMSTGQLQHEKFV